MGHFDCHTHTMYSNIRLLDSTNRPERLIDKAIELGLSGIAITDHEALCSHMKVNKYAKKLRETNPSFTIALGNEVYLTDTRESGQKYYHFILIAKDEIGYRGIKELSSIAWYNVYSDRGMERVPLLKSELTKIMKDYKGHILATTACMGGEASTNALLMAEAQAVGDMQNAQIYYENIQNFLSFCIETFGKENFYIECAPSNNKEQIMVNKKLLGIAKYYGLRMTAGSDSHYLTKEDRWVHKAYLNSKGGDREVDSFYEFTYLMDDDETRKWLKFSFDDETIDWIFDCSNTIKNSIEFYSLEKHQSIEEVDVVNYRKSLSYFGANNSFRDELETRWQTIKSLLLSENIQERYWINQCLDALAEKGLLHDERYLDRLEEEAQVKRIIGEKLQTNMFAYPNTLQHYIDLFWECGSTVGAGRGSACSALNHYLLGITQLDPIEWDFPFFRYMNRDRYEIGDIDIDLGPSKLPLIMKKIREERGELGIVQIATFGTEGTKSAILTGCRGYRSEEFPDGIDVDEAQYLSSLVPIERGFQWSVKDLTEGNQEKGRLPSKTFLNAINQYPGLLDIVRGIEGLVCRRGSHASGVILFDETKIYDTVAIMRTPSGAITTQWDLHDDEAAGAIKYDFLVTAVQDVITQTIELLQKDGLIEKSLTLREVYNKYLHPAILPQDNEKMWNALANGDVIGCFQFDSLVGAQAAKKIKPRSPVEMSDANGLTIKISPNTLYC